MAGAIRKSLRSDGTILPDEGIGNEYRHDSLRRSTKVGSRGGWSFDSRI